MQMEGAMLLAQTFKTFKHCETEPMRKNKEMRYISYKG